VIRALASTDHKVVGLRLAITAAVFFLGGGVLALLMRTELAKPGLQVVSHQGYNELFTMHGSTMIFLVVIPAALAFCVYLVPLQIGATALSGARWALSASWLITLGGVVMWLGWLTREGAGSAGWYAFDPLSEQPSTPGPGMDLWVCGVILATAGATILGWCVLVTVLRRRTPGMTMLRMPVFTWTAFATALLVVFSFPSLVVAMSLLLADRHGASVLDPIEYQNLFWFYGHPAVYVMFFPFVGMVGEAASVFSGQRFFGYKIFIPALLGFTALSMSAWAHHMFTTGAIPVELFSLTSTALIVPAGIEYFDIIATMWRGAVRLTTSMLFVFGFLMQFLIGGLSGIFVASPTLDFHAHDSYIVVAHFHYTLLAGSVFALFAGLYLWWPKFTGRRLSEGLGKTHFWTMAIGTNMTFIPQFILGYDGMARRLPDYATATGWQGLNVVSTIGSFLIAFSILCFLLAVAGSFLRRADVEPDPWGTGMTLEWVAASPPSPRNFDEALPPVRSYAPLADVREREVVPA
jgi:cytochrome c oxidase subunit I